MADHFDDDGNSLGSWEMTDQDTYLAIRQQHGGGLVVLASRHEANLSHTDWGLGSTEQPVIRAEYEDCDHSHLLHCQGKHAFFQWKPIAEAVDTDA